MDKAFKIAVTLSAYDKMSTVINSAVDKAQHKIKKAQKAINSFADSSLLAGGVGAGLFMGAIKSAADMEKMQVALTTSFRGNQAAAESAFKSINSFAATTPYEVGEVMTAFVKLKNMGLDPSEKSLTAYGNTASAMGKDLNQMIEAVADAATFEFERLKEFGIKAKQNKDSVSFLFQGTTTVVRKNAASIEAYLKKIGNVNFAGGIEAQSKTIYGQMSTLKDSFTMAAASIGKMFIPGLNDLFAKAGPVIDKMQLWVTQNPAFIKMLAFTTGALLVVGGAAKILSIILATNPIVLIITAIATAAYLIYDNWGAIKTWFINLWNKVSAIFMGAWNWIKNMFLDYTPYGLVIKHWDKISHLFTQIWRVVKLVFSATWKWIKNMFLNYTPAGLVIKHWSSISTWFSNLWEGVKNVFSSVWAWIKKMFLDYTPAGIIYKHWDEIVQYFTNIWDKVTKIFTNAWKGIKNGLKSFFGVGGDVDKALDRAENALAGNSSVNINGGGSSGFKPSSVNSNSSAFHYAPVIQVGPGGAADAAIISTTLKVDFHKQMQNYQASQKRKAF